jgi:nitronate monooxygenase
MINNLDINANKFHTPLCDLLDIKYPLIQAGMSGFTTPELVASVSNIGALGILGAARLSSFQLKESISKIKEKTNRPFGVNLLLAPPEPRPKSEEVRKVQDYLNRIRQNQEIPLQSATTDIKLPPNNVQEKLKIIMEARVPLLSFGLGDPSQIVKEVHEVGIKVMTMVTTVQEALQVARGGTDIIAVQGAEAGGHRSTFKLESNTEPPLIGTVALVPQVIDALHSDIQKEIPVVATGGITDGRGFIAALSLGASGIILGTRFLTAQENDVFPGYRKSIFNSDGSNTTITKVFTGRYARSIKNEFIDEYTRSGQNPLSWPFQALAADDIYNAAQSTNNPNLFPLLAGQGIGNINNNKDQKASEIIQEIMSEAMDVLRNLNDLTK